MRDIIIGTAGHIDHGKTTLVKALTGKNTDSLPEEKQRGMTIDIGFAFLPLKNGKTAGIVDVPGHEKFIKNMAAGVSAIDMIMMVIACDDGIKPQTVEHMDILQMLGIQKGIIVLTKRDLVDDERAAELKKEVREFFKGSFLEGTEIAEFSIKNPDTSENIKSILEREIEALPSREKDDGNFRMDIDRVFSVKGFGTIVTGTSKKGIVKTGDTLMLYPQMLEVRVKNIESNGRRKESLPAGNRCALNIAGAEVREIKRGDVIAVRDTLILSDRIDCILTLLKGRKIKNNHRVRVNIGTAEVIGRIKIFGADEAEGTALIQLELEKTIPATAGECGIVRNFSPVETIGGVKIINGAGEKVKRKDTSYIEKLKNLSSNEKLKRIESIVKDSNFIDIKSLALFLGEKATADDLKRVPEILQITEDIFIHKENFEKFETGVIEYLREYHIEHPLQQGVKISQLKNRCFEKSSLMVYNKVLEVMKEKNLLKEKNGFISLAEFEIKLSSREKKLKDKIFQMYKGMKFLPQKKNKISENFSKTEPFEEVHRYMAEHLFLVDIGDDRYILKGYFAEAEKLVREKITKDKKITLREGAQLLGTNRETALLILEKLDSRGVTRRVGDYRILKDLQEGDHND